MSDGPVQFTLRRLQTAVTAPRFWAVAAAVAVVLGIAGPFGTQASMALAHRLAYWLTIVVSTFLVGYAVIGFLTTYVLGDFAPLSVRLAVAGFLAGTPVTVIVLLINLAVLGGWPESVSSTLVFGLNCSLIAAAIAVLFGIVDPGRFAADDTLAQPAPAAAPRPALMDRLPAHLRGRLLYMSMQDHYVDVRTDRGGTLVLMRFADAIAEAGVTPGLRIHRSHWVALDAVAGSARRDGRAHVRLVDGTELPVSRGYLAGARAAGLV